VRRRKRRLALAVVILLGMAIGVGCGATWRWVEQTSNSWEDDAVHHFSAVWQIPPEAACFGHLLLNYSRQDKQAQQRTSAVSKIPTSDSLDRNGSEAREKEVTKGIKVVVNRTMYS